jgi:hypothetical protein
MHLEERLMSFVRQRTRDNAYEPNRTPRPQHRSDVRHEFEAEMKGYAAPPRHRGDDVVPA